MKKRKTWLDLLPKGIRETTVDEIIAAAPKFPCCGAVIPVGSYYHSCAPQFSHTVGLAETPPGGQK